MKRRHSGSMPHRATGTAGDRRGRESGSPAPAHASRNGSSGRPSAGLGRRSPVGAAPAPRAWRRPLAGALLTASALLALPGCTTAVDNAKGPRMPAAEVFAAPSARDFQEPPPSARILKINHGWAGEATARQAYLDTLLRQGFGGAVTNVTFGNGYVGNPANWEAFRAGIDLLRGAGLDAWLGPFLGGITRRSQLQRLDLKGALLALLSREQRQALEALAPVHVVVPSGSKIPVDYTAGDAPVLAVRLQEMFGATDTPRIAGGRVPLLLHLLSPAGRPLQVTRDLGGFWTGSYAAVKKEMKGRYPRHPWPDDPIAAPPTHRAKPRGKKG